MLENCAFLAQYAGTLCLIGRRAQFPPCIINVFLTEHAEKEQGFWSPKFNEDFYQEIINNKYYRELDQCSRGFLLRKSCNVLCDHISKQQAAVQATNTPQSYRVFINLKATIPNIRYLIEPTIKFTKPFTCPHYLSLSNIHAEQFLSERVSEHLFDQS